MSLLGLLSVRGLGVVTTWIFLGPLLLLCSPVMERDKMLLRGILSEGVWNGFLLGKAKGETVRCRFRRAPDVDGHLFWDCSFPPNVHVRSLPEFSRLLTLNRSGWPGCLLWHGWLLALSGRTGRTPWAVTGSDFAEILWRVSLVLILPRVNPIGCQLRIGMRMWRWRLVIILVCARMEVLWCVSLWVSRWPVLVHMTLPIR